MNIRPAYIDDSIVELSLFGSNEAPVRPDPGRNGEMEGEVIYAANEGRFESATFEEELTEYTVGWKEPTQLDVLLEFLAPSVKTNQRRFEYKKNVNVEMLQTDTAYNDDTIGVGQDPKRVERSRTTAFDKTLNRALMMRVYHEDVTDDSFCQEYTDWLLSRLYRNSLIRAYGIGLAAAINNAVTWHTDGTACNPDDDLRQAIIAAGNDSGIEPNRAIFGRTAWAARQAAYEALNVFGGGFNESRLTKQQLAEKLELDEVMTFSARYQSTAAAKSLISGLSVLAFFATPGAKKEDPTNLKRFVTSTEGGTPFRVYVEEKAKYTDIMVEHYDKPVLTDSQGIQKLTVTRA